MYTAVRCHIEGGSAPDAEDDKYPKTRTGPLQMLLYAFGVGLSLYGKKS